MASVSGRLITLPAPPVRAGNRWMVPVDFISRALLPIYDQRLELRRPSRLLIVGDLRVPHITIRQEQIGTGARITIESTPRANTAVTQDATHLAVKFEADVIDVALPTAQSPGLLQGYRALDNTTIAIDLGPRHGVGHLRRGTERGPRSSDDAGRAGGAAGIAGHRSARAGLAHARYRCRARRR